MSEASKAAVKWLKKQANKRQLGKLGSIRAAQTTHVVNQVNNNN